jgi:hypothetical protein
MHEQSGLGAKTIKRQPTYDMTQIGRVVGVADYVKYGRIEVIFLDYSKPFPVWVNGSVDRAPVAGDQVLVGFIKGRQDAPYLAGFIRNESYTSNFVLIESDRIVLQLPIDTEDSDGHLLDDTRKASRVSVELTAGGVKINGAYVARVGDIVAVTVPTHGVCPGTITSGATK